MKTCENPNFSIVLPGGCNARCPFCFNKNTPIPSGIELSKYLETLSGVLDKLDDRFWQLSITGGEPTLSPYFLPVLELLKNHQKKFKVVVLTTNGTRLLSVVDEVSEVVGHINLSRHHWSQKANNEIFGNGYKLWDYEVLALIDEFGKRGVDVSVNCVMNDTTEPSFIENYVEWANAVGAYAIRFRKENGNTNPTPAEKYFSDYKVLSEDPSTICRSKLQRIKGATVYWKAAVLEPSDFYRDAVYEIVFQPNGVTYEDWAQMRPIEL